MPLRTGGVSAKENRDADSDSVSGASCRFEYPNDAPP